MLNRHPACPAGGARRGHGRAAAAAATVRRHAAAVAAAAAAPAVRALPEQQVQLAAEAQTQQLVQPPGDGVAPGAGPGRPASASTVLLAAPQGVVWHVRRGGPVPDAPRGPSPAQLAAAALLSVDDDAAAVAGQVLQQQQQQQALGQSPEQPTEEQQRQRLALGQQGGPDEDPDFTLMERLDSNSAASTSDSGGAAALFGGAAGAAAAAAAAGLQGARAAATRLRWMQRGPAANFLDPRFEMALSRWMKEAPDWFKVRLVYERFGGRFNALNLACALSRLADLLCPTSSMRLLRGERRAQARLLKQLLASAAELLPSVDASTGTSLLHSMARLAEAGKLDAADQLLAGALLQHMRPQLCLLEPQELVCTVWSLSVLRHVPPPDLMGDLYVQSQDLLPQLQAEEVAVLLRGLGGIQPSLPPPREWLSALLAHAEEQLELLEAKQLSMMLVGLAMLQVRPHRSWMDAAMSALRGRFDSMGPQSLCNVLWSLSRLGCLPDRSWLGAYFGSTLLLLNSFNAKELAVTAWSLSRLRLEPSDQWLDEFFDQSEARLPRFTLRDLALCGYALAKLGLRPPQTWLRRYCTLLLRLKSGLWRNKKLLTQVLVALDSFKLPRMDMWRRELYAAAGYKLFKFRDWRQRVRVAPSPAGPYSAWPHASRGRRQRTARPAAAAWPATAVTQPAALRSGDWGVMDGLGGSRGVLGSMGGSYEELGGGGGGGEAAAAAAAAAATAAVVAPAAGAAAGAGAWGGREQVAAARVARRPLRATGLVRPAPPPAAVPQQQQQQEQEQPGPLPSQAEEGA